MSNSESNSFMDDEDPLSIAEEVQQLNPDVMAQVMMNDDLGGTENLTRTLSKRYQNTANDEATDIDSLSSASASPQNFTGEGVERRPSAFARRRSTIVESIKRTSTYQKVSKFSWWDSEFKKDRIGVYTEFFSNYLLLSVILIMILGIYWGSYYNRESRYKNLKFLIVNDDLQVNGITPIIGNSVNATAHLPLIQNYGNWAVFSHDDFNEIAVKHNNTIYQEIKRQVHHQKYWAAIYVKPNVTSLLYDAISSNDTSFNVTSNLVEVVYETGRDFITMSSYVTKFIGVFETAFLKVIKQEFSILVNELKSDDDKITAISFLIKPFTFYYNDMVPVASAILAAPLQLGLTFIVVFAFFSLIMTIRIQIYLSTLVTGLKYVLLRMLISQISYIVLSLGYLLVNLAFKIDTSATFGKSGALVLWAIGYLTMSSLGSLNENVALLCFTYNPKLIGGWLVLLMAANMAPTVSPMALTNHFYRYGYAMPIHNSYEAAKVVFSDIYKGQLGRNIGILVAWIVLGNLALPFTMVHISKVRARREAAEKEKAASEAQKN